MRGRIGRIGRPFAGCRGATAVEYGVILGGLALGIAAALAALGVGLGGLFGATGDMARGLGTTAGADPMRVVLRQNFAAGREGWSGAAPRRTLESIGTGLSLARESRSGSGRETVSRSFAIPAGTARAEIRFEMSFVDSWDDERAHVYIDGTQVALGRFSWGSGAPPVLSGSAPPGVTVAAAPVARVQAGTWSDPSRGTDHTYAVVIGIANPGATLRLGFGTTLDQSQRDESLLIGNVELRSDR